MNADAAFITGKTHRVCQDYARADTTGKYVIISDGCSSSPDSDFGSRLLVKSIENAILNPKSVDVYNDMRFTRPPTYPPFNGIAAARDACKTLQLSDQSLDATLIYARYRETILNSDELLQQGIKDKVCPSIEVTMFGDGVAAGLRDDGLIVAYHVDFPTGYPQYLNYRLNPERYAALRQMEGGNQPWQNTWSLQDGKEPIRVQSVRMDANKEDDYSLFFFPIPQFKRVAIFSDGVASFNDASGAVVPWQTIVQMMMEVPEPGGEFVQRNVNWLVKEAAKRKWANQDDFSMGAINL